MQFYAGVLTFLLGNRNSERSGESLSQFFQLLSSNGFSVPWKLSLTLWSHKLVKPTRQLLNVLKTSSLWHYTFDQGLVKSKKFYLEIILLIISEFRAMASSFSHSTLAQRNKNGKAMFPGTCFPFPIITLLSYSFWLYTLHKKWSFPLRISSVNVTKFAGNYGFGHIYWRNP